MIASKLKELVKANELVFRVIDILKGKCVYCKFIPVNRGAKEELHIYIRCFLIEANWVGYRNF
jgi:hypothetical protein